MTGHDVAVALIGAGVALLGWAVGFVQGRAESTRRD